MSPLARLGLLLIIGDVVELNNYSDYSAQNTLSWQSTFFGLLALALNAITQPPTLDGGFPESSLLFLSPISPIICAVDVLEVIHEFLFSFTVEQQGVQDTALRANWRRA